MLTGGNMEVFCYVHDSHTIVLLLPGDIIPRSCFRVTIEILNSETGDSAHFIFSFIMTTWTSFIRMFSRMS